MNLKLFLTSILMFVFVLFSNPGYSQDKKDETTTNIAEACIVCNEKLASVKGIEFQYLGKPYTFCCDGCLAKFKKEPMDYVKEELKCPVDMSESASKDVSTVYNGVKYYFSCSSCLKKFDKDAEKYLEKYKK